MIHITLQLDADGCLRRLQSDGHADGATGQNIVCAAATAVMRSVARVLSGQDDLDVNGLASSEGTMTVDVLAYPDDRGRWLHGVTQVLQQGLEDLAADFPDQLRIDTRQASAYTQGEEDGT